MHYKGNYFHAENDFATLAYPTFTVPLSHTNEIKTTLTPLTTKYYDFDELSAATVETSSQHNPAHLVSSRVAEYLPTSQEHSAYIETFQVKTLSPNAQIPVQATPGSAGFNVTTMQDITLLPGEIKKAATGLSMSIPKTLYLRIAPRSSLALQHITIEGGGGGC
jgi:hypothetical protein